MADLLQRCTLRAVRCRFSRDQADTGVLEYLLLFFFCGFSCVSRVSCGLCTQTLPKLISLRVIALNDRLVSIFHIHPDLPQAREYRIEDLLPKESECSVVRLALCCIVAEDSVVLCCSIGFLSLGPRAFIGSVALHPGVMVIDTDIPLLAVLQSCVTLYLNECIFDLTGPMLVALLCFVTSKLLFSPIRCSTVLCGSRLVQLSV